MYHFGRHDYDTLPIRTTPFIWQADNSVTDTILHAFGHLVCWEGYTYLVTTHIPYTWEGLYGDTLSPEDAVRAGYYPFDMISVNYDSSDHDILPRILEFFTSDTACLQGRLRFWYDRAVIGNSPYTDRLPAIWIDRAEDITIEPNSN